MLAVSFTSYAKSYEQNCFAEHIRESIVINSARKPFYRKLTGGKSDEVFNFSITSERASLIPAAYFDWKARAYQKKGVPLFCYEFMSMNATPDFDPERHT